MSHERLHEAIKTQADELKRRVEWLKQMIERQNGVIVNAQETIGHYQTDLTAANLALDGLRSEWKKHNGSQEKT